MEDLLKEIGRKDSDKAAIAARIAKDPAAVRDVLDAVGVPAASVRYGCAKVLHIISEREPCSLYPHFDRFVPPLGGENRILHWEALSIIANLAPVDSEGHIAGILDRYLEGIRGPVMITAGNIIKGAARIAIALPHLTERIVNEMLSVENGEYATAECRNVALGHVLDALDTLYHQITDRDAALSFARRQVNNPRKATRDRAGRFLRRHGSA